MNLPENSYPVVCYGEILWDVLPSGAVPGGAPMNLAYHLKKLGINPALITKVGSDTDGKKLIQLMERNGISAEFFQMDFEKSTGRVDAIAGENNEFTYDIKKPAAWDFISWENQFESLLPGTGYFAFGSLSTRSKESRNTLFRLLEIAKYKVLDINLRPPFYTRRHIEQLLNGLSLLKLNMAELELLTGWFSHYKNERDRIGLLQDRFRIPQIVVTKGSAGAVFCTESGFYEHPGYAIEPADTIGSGDAFLAALISKLLQGAQPRQALEFANALGALIATKTGPCPEYSLDEIQDLITTKTLQ